MAAKELIKQLKTQFSLTITCNTPTGSQEIKKLFGESVQHLYLPLDLPGNIKRFLTALKPTGILILETELWPNLIIQADKHAIPVCVINARLSEKSLKGYQKISPLSRQIMTHIRLLAAHTNDDAERFLALGLAKHKKAVTGSLKFDIALDNSHDKNIAQLSAQLAHYDFIWVAGSTHPGEHEQIIAAHQALLKTIPNALLIIAPRHPEQFNNVADYLTKKTLPFSRRSKEQHTDQKVLLADTLGEMLTLFGSAHTGFIGGSLIERGGHNPLEAAAFKLPVITGPSYTNFQQIYTQLIKDKGCYCIKNSNELTEKLIELAKCSNLRGQIGNNAYAILAANRGAVARTIDLIKNEVPR
jgi:3-deoxy-D-manno-octulosonic-acid transferase